MSTTSIPTSLKMKKFSEAFKQFLSNVSRKKPLDKSIQQSDTPKTLRWYALLAYGVAATVGGGIYVTVGNVARDYTGPAVVISTLGSGVLSLLTAFCYLELAAMIPATGSSYVYGYSYLGELFGFIMGWLATLEYAFAAAVTGIGWTEYLVALIQNTGLSVPSGLYGTPLDNNNILVVNPLAFIVILVVSIVVLQGVHFGTKFNNGLTTINIIVILFIIIAGSTQIKVENYNPFVKDSISGVFTGAAVMMYSYIGFDTICNLSSDAVSARHLQIGVIGTVAIATALYIAVGFAITGMIPFQTIPDTASLSAAFTAVGMNWGSYIVQACALSMTFATLLACLIGQPRIFEMMAKDGLLPQIFCKKSGKSGLTIINMIMCCMLSAILALFINLNSLVDLISAGALIGFSGSAAGLIMARLRQNPKVERIGSIFLGWLFSGSLLTWPFLHSGHTWIFVPLVIIMVITPFVLLCMLFYRNYDTLGKTSYVDTTISTLCPYMPLIPCLSIIGNTSVVTSLPANAFYFLAVWIVIGLVIYFGYSYRHAKLKDEDTLQDIEPSKYSSHEDKEMGEFNQSTIQMNKY